METSMDKVAEIFPPGSKLVTEGVRVAVVAYTVSDVGVELIVANMRNPDDLGMVPYSEIEAQRHG